MVSRRKTQTVNYVHNAWISQEKIVSSNSVAITHVQVKKQKVVNVESDITLLDRQIIFQQLLFKILTLSLHKQQAFL